MTCAVPTYSPQNALDTLARYLPKLIGTSLPIEPSVQSEKATADPIPHAARVALQRLEAVYSVNQTAAQVLWYAFVSHAGSNPSDVALVFAEPWQRTVWLTVPAAAKMPLKHGRSLIDQAIELWEDAPDYTPAHRSLSAWIADIDRRVYECRSQVDEIKQARALVSQRKKVKVNHKKLAMPKSDT